MTAGAGRGGRFRFGVVVFPGSNCDVDARRALGEVLGQEVVDLWHAGTDLQGCDALVLPGGFSYGDALRAGAIARFAPIMEAVERFATAGGPVLGICNGFQILCEAGLLPGALHRNRDLKFHCHDVHVRVETDRTPFTRGLTVGEVLRLPIAHGEGCYTAPPEVLEELERRRQVVFRYVDARGEATAAANPNGSAANIGGICNAAGNVVGLMPHPERCVERLLGGEDGRRILEAAVRWLAGDRAPAGGQAAAAAAPREALVPGER
ncbi:MAG TPA: phosphoribosylformylglycinamidine synthase subunit PurQ [Bacillota bacterium]